MKLIVVAYIEVIRSGFKTANTEEGTCETEHINSSLVVVVFTGEETLNTVGAVKSLRVGHYAAEESNQFVGVPCRVLTYKQIGTGGTVVSVISLVDVCTEHVNGLNTANSAGFVHLGDDVSALVVIFGNGFRTGSVKFNCFDFNLAACGHIRLIYGSRSGVAGFSRESAVAVKQLGYPVNSHKRHTLYIV